MFWKIIFKVPFPFWDFVFALSCLLLCMCESSCHILRTLSKLYHILLWCLRPPVDGTESRRITSLLAAVVSPPSTLSRGALEEVESLVKSQASGDQCRRPLQTRAATSCQKLQHEEFGISRVITTPAAARANGGQGLNHIRGGPCLSHNQWSLLWGFHTSSAHSNMKPRNNQTSKWSTW